MSPYLMITGHCGGLVHLFDDVQIFDVLFFLRNDIADDSGGL